MKNVAAFVLTQMDGRKLPEGAKADIEAGKRLRHHLRRLPRSGRQGHPSDGRSRSDPPGAFIYGSSFAQLQQTIRYGRRGVMPAQQEHLGNDKVHLLAAYVYSLSHGEKSAE